ncbi:hypothetical protein THRCLA_07784 [Thraustotheca clavata]|uniref:Uncharacterized protein n=1 Tax=Thraustotheca clavata TaxID=74557 RepID=A0A1V9ZC24_9STRA|nr:hypothetical protein THRCLA_07784 [Thraustotheca clavata]
MIQAIFYSEFDNIAGPQIVYQAPPNALSNEVFDSVSGYIIIDKALCGKIITVCPQDIKIVGYPVCIEDDKYHRNALLFNIGFVFHRTMDSTPYKPILRKLGSLMETMEKESGFLSQESTKSKLATILPAILNDLTHFGECTIPIDTANIINLKLFPKLLAPPNVHDYEVPVAIRDLKTLLQNSAEWDLALQKIVPFIDGVNYVKRIAITAEVDLSIVKNCMRQLLYYGCITMIDIFLHTNIYTTTEKISMLMNDADLQRACVNYVAKDEDNPPTFQTVFNFYCAFQPGITVSQIWNSKTGQQQQQQQPTQQLQPQALLVDLRRLVTFGLIHGFLRRIHRYPIAIDRSQRAAPPLSSSPSSVNVAGLTAPNPSALVRVKTSPPQGVRDKDKVKKMMDGEHHTDEICCAFMLRFSDLENILQSEPHLGTQLNFAWTKHLIDVMAAQVVTLSCKGDVQVDWKCSSGQLVYLDQIVASYGTLAMKNEGKLVAPATGIITILPLSTTESNEKEIQVATIELCMHPIVQNHRCVVCMRKVEQETVKVILPQGRIMEVNQAVAKELDGENIERMLKHKKLMLVLDLDHTLLHAVRTTDLVGEVDDEAMRFYIPNIPTEHVLKLRPGLSTFLSELSTLYDLHIYTHGTRSYAERITEIIDPDNTLFRHRIVARTDTPDVGHKSLKLLFPSCDDSMIVVLDDRVDVWKENSDNVFIIEAFHYFNTRAEINNASGGQVKAEVKERKPDNHLTKALRILKLVHEKFYQTTNGQLNVKYIMENMRHNVLRGCNIVFSGVIPIDIPPENDYIWKLATSFGAKPSMTMENFPITHLVIHPKRLGTKKYLEALKMPNVNVVNPQWLIDCASEWMRLREDRYRIRTFAQTPKTEEEKEAGIEETKESEIVDVTENAQEVPKVDDVNEEETKEDSSIPPVFSSTRPPPAKGILVKQAKAKDGNKGVAFDKLPEKINAPFTTAMRRKPLAMTHIPVPAAPVRPKVVAKGVVATGGSFDFLSKMAKRAPAPIVKSAPTQPIVPTHRIIPEPEPDIDDIFARLEREEQNKSKKKEGENMKKNLKRKIDEPSAQARKCGKQTSSGICKIHKCFNSWFCRFTKRR